MLGLTLQFSPLVQIQLLPTKEAAKAESMEMQVEIQVVRLEWLDKGMALHAECAKCGYESLDMILASALVDMYGKCGSMVDAHRVFNRMPRHDVVSWTALIQGYAENGQAQLALDLFHYMQHQSGCIPNSQTYIAALGACSELACVHRGREIHAQICSRGLHTNPLVANSLLDFYGKCGSIVKAEEVFASLEARLKNNRVTWSVLIAGYARQGDMGRVFELFGRMREEGVQPGRVTFVSLLTACSHAGLVDKDNEYFQLMCGQYGIRPGLEHYHCMIDMLGRANRLEEAVGMVRSMPFEPGVVAWKIVMAGCLKWRNVEIGKVAFDELLKLNVKQDVAYVLMSNIYKTASIF